MTLDNWLIGREIEKKDLTVDMVKGPVVARIWGAVGGEDKSAEHRGFLGQ